MGGLRSGVKGRLLIGRQWSCDHNSALNSTPEEGYELYEEWLHETSQSEHC